MSITPRHCPTLPLPPYSYVPGHEHPHPVTDPRGHLYGQAHPAPIPHACFADWPGEMRVHPSFATAVYVQPATPEKPRGRWD